MVDAQNKLFNASAELEAVQMKRAELKRKHYRKSRLEKFRAELVALRLAGASGQDLVIWLKAKRMKIDRSSIERYLSKLSKIKKGDE